MNTFKKVLIELIADSRLYFYDCKNTTFIKYTKLKQKNTFLKNLARLHCQKLFFHNLASLMWGITFVCAKKRFFSQFLVQFMSSIIVRSAYQGSKI